MNINLLKSYTRRGQVKDSIDQVYLLQKRIGLTQLVRLHFSTTTNWSAIYNNLGWKMWEDYTKYELIQNVPEKWINFIICDITKLELENKDLYCSLSYSCRVWLKEVCSFCQKAFYLYSYVNNVLWWWPSFEHTTQLGLEFLRSIPTFILYQGSLCSN